MACIPYFKGVFDRDVRAYIAAEVKKRISGHDRTPKPKIVPVTVVVPHGSEECANKGGNHIQENGDLHIAVCGILVQKLIRKARQLNKSLAAIPSSDFEDIMLPFWKKSVATTEL